MPSPQTFCQAICTLPSVLVISSVYPLSFSDIGLLFENGGLANLHSLAVPPSKIS